MKPLCVLVAEISLIECFKYFFCMSNKWLPLQPVLHLWNTASGLLPVKKYQYIDFVMGCGVMWYDAARRGTFKLRCHLLCMAGIIRQVEKNTTGPRTAARPKLECSGFWSHRHCSRMFCDLIVIYKLVDWLQWRICGSIFVPFRIFRNQVCVFAFYTGFLSAC